MDSRVTLNVESPVGHEGLPIDEDLVELSAESLPVSLRMPKPP